MAFIEEPIPFRIQITKVYITEYIALRPQRKRKDKKIKTLWLRTLQPQRPKLYSGLPALEKCECNYGNAERRAYKLLGKTNHVY